jgi:hypothetical protein
VSLHGCGKSDPAIVASKPANKAAPAPAGGPAAEPAERRAGAEGNASAPHGLWPRCPRGSLITKANLECHEARSAGISGLRPSLHERRPYAGAELLVSGEPAKVVPLLREYRDEAPDTAERRRPVGVSRMRPTQKPAP